jgi:hypothetical protein
MSMFPCYYIMNELSICSSDEISECLHPLKKTTSSQPCGHLQNPFVPLCMPEYK